jgi:hypothetical protein
MVLLLHLEVCGPPLIFSIKINDFRLIMLASQVVMMSPQNLLPVASPIACS